MLHTVTLPKFDRYLRLHLRAAYLTFLLTLSYTAFGLSTAFSVRYSQQLWFLGGPFYVHKYGRSRSLLPTPRTATFVVVYCRTRHGTKLWNTRHYVFYAWLVGVHKHNVVSVGQKLDFAAVETKTLNFVVVHDVCAECFKVEIEKKGWQGASLPAPNAELLLIV